MLWEKKVKVDLLCFSSLIIDVLVRQMKDNK